MNRLILAFLLAAPAAPAFAHDFWSNGEAVPKWTKTWCCGQADVHRLYPGAIHIQADGYHVAGLSAVLPFSKAMPSPDGFYWAFFKDEEGADAHVSCFYAPMNGS